MFSLLNSTFDNKGNAIDVDARIAALEAAVAKLHEGDAWTAAQIRKYNELLATFNATSASDYNRTNYDAYAEKVQTAITIFNGGTVKGDDNQPIKLDAAITAANNYYNGTLQNNSLVALRAAIAKADALMADGTATKDDFKVGNTNKYDAAVNVLNAALSRGGTTTNIKTTTAALENLLAEFETSTLEAVIAKATQIENKVNADLASYTTASYKVFTEALSAARIAKDYAASLQPQYQAALETAMANLVETTNLVALVDEKAPQKTDSDYDFSTLTSAQFSALEKALSEAKTKANLLLSLGNATAAQVADAEAALKDALDAFAAYLKPLTADNAKAKADALAAAAKLVEADYTADDWAGLQAVVKALEETNENSKIENAVNALTDKDNGAIAELVSIAENKAQLEKYVAAATDLIAGLNKDSYQVEQVKSALETANTLLEKAATLHKATEKYNGSTFNDKTAAPKSINALKAYVETNAALVKASSDYQNALAAAAALITTDYTEASVKTFNTIVESYEDMDDKNATAANLNNAVKAIEAAYNELVPVAADKTELNALLAQAAALKADDFAAESWAKLEAAVAQGNAAELKSEVAAAVAVLKDALNGLVKIDRSALEVLVEQAKALKADDYTAESYAKVTEALSQAEAAKTQEEVDAAVAALKEAIAGLEKAPVEELPVLKLLNKCPASYKLSLSKEGTNYTHIKTTWDDIDGVKIEYAWYSTNSSIVKASTADIDGNGVACDIVTEGVKAGSAICICVVKATLPDGTTATAAHAMTIKVVK